MKWRPIFTGEITPDYKGKRFPNSQETKYKSTSMPGFILLATSSPARYFTIPPSSPVSARRPRPDPSSTSPTLRVYIKVIFSLYLMLSLIYVLGNWLSQTSDLSRKLSLSPSNNEIFFAPHIFPDWKEGWQIQWKKGTILTGEITPDNKGKRFPNSQETKYKKAKAQACQISFF